MISVPIHKAKACLSKLVARACVRWRRCRDRIGEATARSPDCRESIPERKFGALRDKLIVDDTFFDPLPEAELAAWE